MTPRERVEAVLRGEEPDRIPFTIYEYKLPQCAVERQLRNDGLCIVNRGVPVFKSVTPDVATEAVHYTDKGVSCVRTVYHTPYGDLSTVQQPAGFTSWTKEKLFKTPDDYRRLLFMTKNTRVEADYGPFVEAQKQAGDDIIYRAGIGSNPLHAVMIGWMGVETFALEWADNRDEIEKLCRAMADNLRKIFPIVAKSPALHANFGGNETGDVMGRDRFEKYVFPLYQEAGEVFRKHAKYLGTHLDGNNRVWADLVGKSALDYVEAFTPAPDTDMSLADAFHAWPGKTMWINFPSSLHLADIETIERTTRELMAAAPEGKRLIIGITEDMPPDRWQENLLAISRVINKQ